MTACKKCRDLTGAPVKMVTLYVKNHPSRMNKGQDPFSPIGSMCPQCEKMEKKTK